MNAPILPYIKNFVVESKDNGALTMTAGLDTKGYDFARFIICTGTVAVDFGTSPKITECDTVDGTYADITGATQTVEAADDDGTWVIDIKLGGGRKRFLKPAATAGDGSGTASEMAIICLLYKAETRANTYADGGLAAAADWVSV